MKLEKAPAAFPKTEVFISAQEDQLSVDGGGDLVLCNADGSEKGPKGEH